MIFPMFSEKEYSLGTKNITCAFTEATNRNNQIFNDVKHPYTYIINCMT